MTFMRSFITFRRRLFTITATARYLSRCCEVVWIAFRYLHPSIWAHSCCIPEGWNIIGKSKRAHKHCILAVSC